MSSLKHNNAGFTGLEAAIVLIAFVVVAAVFSYVVLGAGFFTTQKAQEAVHSGVLQATSSLELVGNVYGIQDPSNTAGIEYVNFSLGLAAGGTPVDVSKTVFIYSNETQLVTMTPPSTWTGPTYPSATGSWAISDVQNNPSSTFNAVLQPNEQFTITAQVGGSVATDIPANDIFTLEIRPSGGAAFSITRTVPAAIQGVNLMY
jgi:flagellin FlaB